jgi:predicted GIY-YIG superfamily endonuclease
VKTVYEMRKRLNREKDQKDLRLMEQYMDERGIKYEPQLKKLSAGLKIQCVNENPNKFA